MRYVLIEQHNLVRKQVYFVLDFKFLHKFYAHTKYAFLKQQLSMKNMNYDVNIPPVQEFNLL